MGGRRRRPGVRRALLRVAAQRHPTGWSALSPGFQAEIGGYDHYVGFWSTISGVSVTDTQPAGKHAVDVSLTYTRDDGSTASEVRRLFLEREDAGYLITGDQVVG